MEFLTKLKERNIGDKQALRNFGIFEDEHMHRMHTGLPFGPFILSIQASYYHYCSPRITIDKDIYSSMEVGVLKDGELINIMNDEVFNDFEDRYLVHDSWDGCGVYAYLDVNLIESLFQFLKKKYAQTEVLP